MEYIGNFKDWLNPEWIEEILAGNGKCSPRDLLLTEEPHSEDIRVKKAGYSMSAFYYSLFESDDVSFELAIPGIPSGNVRWWITKMTPGQFMPMHRDPRITKIDNIERFWMPWTNWDYGHVFAYKDTVVSNYNAGDLYKMTDADALHGSANIGLTSRITLNIGVVRNNI